MESLTASIAAESSPPGVTEHAAEDSGIVIIPTVVTNRPPDIVIENFSSASVGATHDPDLSEGFAWTRTHVYKVRQALAHVDVRFSAALRSSTARRTSRAVSPELPGIPASALTLSYIPLSCVLP